jgi:sugar/nucleoside kinase (ribokinase family)
MDDASHVYAHLDDAPVLGAIARHRGMTISLDPRGGPAYPSPRSVDEVLEHADVLFANPGEAAAIPVRRGDPT